HARRLGYKGRTSNAAKCARHHFFWNCVALLHQSSSDRRLQELQELTGLRARRSLILQHGLCRGIDRLGREYASWSRTRAPSSQSALVAMGRGRECNLSRSPVWEGLGAALSVEMMTFDRSINVRVRWPAGGLRYSEVRLLLRCWRESQRAPSPSMIKWRRGAAGSGDYSVAGNSSPMS